MPQTSIPPAPELTIKGESADARVMQAVKGASEALKQAGVSTLYVMEGSADFPTQIMPMGGNRDAVNRVLDAIRDDLKAAGYTAEEGPAFRCANSSKELTVSRQSQAR